MSLKGKGPVVHLNRSLKAKMIEAFLLDATGAPIEEYNLLDIGCGNGQTSEYFSEKNQVYAVDVKDQRKTETQLNFQLVENEHLPFDNGFFDIVFSHHVIEHVNDQTKHLSEIKRVLKKPGLAYLGCPNRSSPFMAGHVGNNKLLDYQDALNLFDKVGLEPEEYYTRLLSNPDKYHCEVNIGKFLPTMFIKLFKPWYPSHCFILRNI
jgi:SAM-dependent methyltransferase